MISADSNVFIYLSDDSAPIKQRAALAITARLQSVDAAISLQVVGEVRHVLRRKFGHSGWRASEVAHNLLRTYSTFGYSRRAVERALEQSAVGRLSYWDALLLAAADEAGCTTFFSEDMQDGGRWGRMEIVNPFAPDGVSPRAREVLEGER